MASDRAFILHMCIPYGKIFVFGTKIKVICRGQGQKQGHIFGGREILAITLMISDRTFTVHIYIPCVKIFLWSSLNVKVKYQCHFQKIVVCEFLVFRKHILFNFTVP